MNRIQDKVALITGAAKGIGKETAKLFAKEGAIVIITDILDEKGKELETEINSKYPNQALYLHLDVASEKNWIEVIKNVEIKYQRLDILYNNAGITGLGIGLGLQDPENASVESWNFVHQVNLNSIFLGCKYAIKLMKKNTSPDYCSIINMSSRSGIVGIPTLAAYASSKAAIRNHTKSVALYCASNGYKIRCNSIHPASILTDIWDDMLPQNPKEKNEALKKIASSIPLGKMGEAKDVAYAVLFLASNESKFITGTELNIDGGILAGSSASPKSSSE